MQMQEPVNENSSAGSGGISGNFPLLPSTFYFFDFLCFICVLNRLNVLWIVMQWSRRFKDILCVLPLNLVKTSQMILRGFTLFLLYFPDFSFLSSLVKFFEQFFWIIYSDFSGICLWLNVIGKPVKQHVTVGFMLRLLE